LNRLEKQRASMWMSPCWSNVMIARIVHLN